MAITSNIFKPSSPCTEVGRQYIIYNTCNILRVPLSQVRRQAALLHPFGTTQPQRIRCPETSCREARATAVNSDHRARFPCSSSPSSDLMWMAPRTLGKDAEKHTYPMDTPIPVQHKVELVCTLCACADSGDRLAHRVVETQPLDSSSTRLSCRDSYGSVSGIDFEMFLDLS